MSQSPSLEIKRAVPECLESYMWDFWPAEIENGDFYLLPCVRINFQSWTNIEMLALVLFSLPSSEKMDMQLYL